MKKESKASLELRNASARHNASGVAFIGSPLDSFHMIIRCPIHVYCVIKKAINLFEDPPQTSFTSCVVPIHDLALDKFIGTFIYRRPSDNKVQKFNAALIIPTDLNSTDFQTAWRLFQALNYAGYEFINKNTNKSFKTLLVESDFGANLFLDSDLQNFCESFCSTSPNEVK